MKRVVLHIDRLVLKGAAHGDRLAIGDALRHELARQLARPQAAQAVSARRDTAQLRLGKVAIRNGANTTQVGTQLGRSIARGLKP